MTSTFKGNRRLAWKLTIAAVAMSGLGYLMVPLYQSVCRMTGLNGSTGHIDYSAALRHVPDKSRLVTVEFVTNTAADMPWEFQPLVSSLRVHPGEIVTTRFSARNFGTQAMVGQAVPSVTPGQAAAYFYSVDGLCTSSQPLAPGEGKLLPLQFVVAPDLPPRIGTLILSVAFFAMPGLADRDQAPVTLALSSPL